MKITSTDYCFDESYFFNHNNNFDKNKSPVFDMFDMIYRYMMENKKHDVGTKTPLLQILNNLENDNLNLLNMHNKSIPDMLDYHCELLVDEHTEYPDMISLNNVDAIIEQQKEKSHFTRMYLKKDTVCWKYDSSIKTCAVVEYQIGNERHYIATIVGFLLKPNNDYPSPSYGEFNFNIDIMDYINPEFIDEGLQYDYIQEEALKLLQERALKHSEYKEVQRYNHYIKGNIKDVIDALIEDGYCFQWINNDAFTEFCGMDRPLDIFESEIGFYELGYNGKPDSGISLFGLGFFENMPFQIDTENNSIKTVGVVTFENWSFNMPQYATPLELKIMKKSIAKLPEQDEFIFDNISFIKENPNCLVEGAQLDYVGKGMLDLLKERVSNLKGYENTNLNEFLINIFNDGKYLQWCNHSMFPDFVGKDVLLEGGVSDEFSDDIYVLCDKDLLDFNGTYLNIIELRNDMPYQYSDETNLIKTFGVVYFEYGINQITYAIPLELKVVNN